MSMYKGIIKSLHTKGVEVETRNGPCLTLFNHSVYYTSSDKVFNSIRYYNIKGILGELYTFLQVDGCGTNTKAFQNNGCRFWDEFGDKYIPYNSTLVKFNGVNQIDEASKRLTKSYNSGILDRQNVITLVSPSLNPNEYKPCATVFQMQYFNNILYFTMYMRSADIMLGYPNDIALAYILANKFSTHFTGCQIVLTVMVGNLHLYKKHFIESKKFLSIAPPSNFSVKCKYSSIDTKDDKIQLVNSLHYRVNCPIIK